MTEWRQFKKHNVNTSCLRSSIHGHTMEVTQNAHKHLYYLSHFIENLYIFFFAGIIYENYSFKLNFKIYDRWESRFGREAIKHSSGDIT